MCVCMYVWYVYVRLRIFTVCMYVCMYAFIANLKEPVYTYIHTYIHTYIYVAVSVGSFKTKWLAYRACEVACKQRDENPALKMGTCNIHTYIHTYSLFYNCIMLACIY